MRVLLSAIGSRGEIQPVLALALRLREMGHEARVCAPPDFRGLIDSCRIPFVPIGPEVRQAQRPTTKEELRELGKAMLLGQFTAVGQAAEGCDAIVASGMLQFATPSVAQQRGIPYFFATYCPITLPSPHHAPAPVSMSTVDPTADFPTQWKQEGEQRNAAFRQQLNELREQAGMAPVDDVRAHMLTARPLLAADPALGPWPGGDLQVIQTGAWLLQDDRPLAPELERFLDAGDPPIYFGFGSMHSPRDNGRVSVEAARSLGYRVIVSKGWADLSVVDGPADGPADGPVDFLAIDEVNHQALFPRVAAIVHHGGAGTTTAATRAGVPQVVVPHMFDQFYWAQRVQELGIGAEHRSTTLTTESLTTALKAALESTGKPPEIRTDGVDTTVQLVTGSPG